MEIRLDICVLCMHLYCSTNVWLNRFVGSLLLSSIYFVGVETILQFKKVMQVQLFVTLGKRKFSKKYMYTL